MRSTRSILALAMGQFSRFSLLSLVGLGLLAGCERPPVDTVQRGPRGTGMELVYNPRTVAAQADLHKAPEALPPVPADGPKASEIYSNVKVLGDLSVGQFARTMVAMTAWVAPDKGCVYCHNPQNFADDSLYTKLVSLRMLQMTQTINADWKSHVGDTGVTCYTCHRGHNVPKEVWFQPLVPKSANSFAGDRAGQNALAPELGLSSLPVDPYSPYLLDQQAIRVQGSTALPAGNHQSTKQAEWTYALMMHMSKSLGVNCNQCHNSRAFGSWENSSPPRLTAWHGIRMARQLNTDFMLPLTSTFPAQRLGPTGDVAKVNCATCHQGAHKPLYGAPMLKAHPELATKTWGKPPAAAAAAASSPGPAASAPLTTADLQAVQRLAQLQPVSPAAPGVAPVPATMSATMAATTPAAARP